MGLDISLISGLFERSIHSLGLGVDCDETVSFLHCPAGDLDADDRHQTKETSTDRVSQFIVVVCLADDEHDEELMEERRD